MVFVQGSNFKNTTHLQCRFGSRSSSAVFISGSIAYCFSPAQPPGSVVVELSINGESWTNSRMLFHYTACTMGNYCPANEAVMCPVGAFCIGGFNYTLCEPGSFQSASGQSKCLPCPKGRYCPEVGLTSPGLICPPGYVCDKEALHVPVKTCRPGHFCLAGTKTSDPSSLETPFRPQVCAAGFYCSHAVSTPVSEVFNFSTPQPCMPGYACSAGSETPYGQGPCPGGFHCPQYAPGMTKICPPSTFCPGVANIEPMRCIPGTSNELYGQIGCSRCPVGSICPDYGMERPEICPAGFVCDIDGLAVWSKQCPPGYFCREGRCLLLKYSISVSSYLSLSSTQPVDSSPLYLTQGQSRVMLHHL